MDKEKYLSEGYRKDVKVGLEGEVILSEKLQRDLNIQPRNTIIFCKKVVALK